MAESKATAPEFVLNIDVDMDEAVDLRKRLKAAANEGQPVPSFNDFVVKASALALLEFPRANGAYRDGKFELYSRVNVGVAVAGQDALVVPTVFDADTKSLGAIARDTRALAERVRAGAITPPELSSGTFTVSNLGMFGIQSFVAVINPPQAAILAVGAMAPTPVVRDGEVVVRNIMRLTLACDHRILYGADAAEFLGRIRERLEEPAPARALAQKPARRASPLREVGGFRLPRRERQLRWVGRVGCERGQWSPVRAAVVRLGAVAVHKWTRGPFGHPGWPLVHQPDNRARGMRACPFPGRGRCRTGQPLARATGLAG